MNDWPAFWIFPPDLPAAPVVFACRRRFTSPTAGERLRFHVTACERYELWLDGARLGRGPDRGDLTRWHYRTHELALAAGPHVLVARVWHLGPTGFCRPAAQVTWKPGFLLRADSDEAAHERLSTGVAPWEAGLIGGFRHLPTWPVAHLAGGAVEIDGAAFPWGLEAGDDLPLPPAVAGAPGRARVSFSTWGDTSQPRLRATTLPPQLDRPFDPGLLRVRHAALLAPGANPEETAVDPRAHDTLLAAALAGALHGGVPFVLPPGRRLRALVDTGTYLCAYAEVRLAGPAGGALRLHWAESLYPEPSPRALKGDRDAVDGRFFLGRGDRFLTGGDATAVRAYRPLWWSCGRYLELLLESGSAGPLVLHGLTLHETRYPLERAGAVALGDDGRFAALEPVLWRTQEVCAHETFFDCPYYEQLQYAGDTRLQVLLLYSQSRDDRLPRQALEAFAASRQPSGLTRSNYPSGGGQVIPQFSLWWIAMGHDFALWRDDPALVRALLPGARSILEAWLAETLPSGLVRCPEGWDWMDWVPRWRDRCRGGPPTGADGTSAVNNLLLLHVLGLAADLEDWHGEAVLADRLRARAARLAAACRAAYWSEHDGLFADTADGPGAGFSEHAQALAILSGAFGPAVEARLLAGLLARPDLERTTIYFRHYVFEAFARLGRAEALLDRLDLWDDLRSHHLRTALECPEPSRSDCHAWSSHPLFHAAASLAGIRPDPRTPGFAAARIAPRPGPLTSLHARVPHPRGGEIEVRLQRTGEGPGWRGEVRLPEGVPGTLVTDGREHPLPAGAHTELALTVPAR